MGDIHYMISEAAKCVGVESHVLRYWEEELELPIERTEMGHRYYTKDDIQLFHCIRKLKDEGVLLKELKILVPEMQKVKKQCRIDRLIQVQNVHTEKSHKKETDNNDIASVLRQVLLDNNGLLESQICNMVTESMKREMTYILDAKEQLEEDRYRKLDTLIRQQQISRREAANKKIPAAMRQLIGFN